MSTTPSLPDASNIAGPFLLGYLFNYGLFGVLTVQTFVYYNAFPNDHAAFQTIVYSVYVAEILQTVMITWDAFQNFTFGFMQADSLNKMNLVWFDCCFIDGAVAFVVQTFFAYRLYLLSKSKLLTGAIIFMALAQCTGAIVAGIIAKNYGVFADLRDKVFVPACFWLGGSAACDIVIAVSTTYVLSRYDTTFNATKDLLRRIIRLTVETGSVTATVATVDLIVFLVFPSATYHMTPTLNIAKVYSNSMMVIFNSRVRMVGGRDQSKGIMSFSSQGHLGLETLNDQSRDSEMFKLRTYRSQRSGGTMRAEAEVSVGDGQTRSQLRSNVDLHAHPIQLNALEVCEMVRSGITES
ncbi:hypothetical protein E1B28_009559 [Marasmius oreades]|uniref:DUF6534 domain-containing protein n=1 Tax=Marasmius oreades TaxID=181124 RepID=A0A9P7RWG6_9AGAR|nr:uncharacterized protein E1B28_009559 [Marasmius oreades]KAG7090441.1 hypothetical protein E1B28_009559 [Marasmius oreades]